MQRRLTAFPRTARSTFLPIMQWKAWKRKKLILLMFPPSFCIYTIREWAWKRRKRKRERTSMSTRRQIWKRYPSAICIWHFPGSRKKLLLLKTRRAASASMRTMPISGTVWRIKKEISIRMWIPGKMVTQQPLRRNRPIRSPLLLTGPAVPTKSVLMQQEKTARPWKQREAIYWTIRLQIIIRRSLLHWIRIWQQATISPSTVRSTASGFRKCSSFFWWLQLAESERWSAWSCSHCRQEEMEKTKKSAFTFSISGTRKSQLQPPSWLWWEQLESLLSASNFPTAAFIISRILTETTSTADPMEMKQIHGEAWWPHRASSPDFWSHWFRTAHWCAGSKHATSGNSRFCTASATGSCLPEEPSMKADRSRSERSLCSAFSAACRSFSAAASECSAYSLPWWWMPQCCFFCCARHPEENRLNMA